MANLFEKIFKPDKYKKQQEALKNAQGFFRLLNGYRPSFTTWQGEIYESELVRSSIDARARHISKLKIEIHGSAQASLQTQLKQRPNPWQTWSQFMYRASTILDNNNTLFIVPVHDDNLNVIGYYTILPQNVDIVSYENEPWLRYKFSNGKIAAVEFKKCGVMTKFQYENDFFGTQNNALKDTMELIHIQKEGIKEGIKTSNTYRFMAELSNFSNTEDIAKERKRFTSENLKNDKGNGGLLLFPNTYRNAKQIEMKPYIPDSEQMSHIRTNVFNYFGVNDNILQNKAYGDEWAAFYEGAIEPFAIQFSEVMTNFIFTNNEIARGAGIMATSNRLQYLSNADKLNVSSQMADRGVMSRNEIREIWNLPPIENGDIPVIRGEYKPLKEGTENE